METTLNGAFQELFSKVDPYIKEDPTRIDKYFWNCSSANLSMNKRKDLLRNIIYKYEHDNNLPENFPKEFVPYIKNFIKINHLYKDSKKDFKHGEILFLILKEVFNREESNQDCVFTELQKFIYNLHYSLPDAYIPGIHRGYYCDFIKTKPSYIEKLFKQKTYIYFKKEGKNFRLNEAGQNKLSELAIKFSL